MSEIHCHSCGGFIGGEARPVAYRVPADTVLLEAGIDDVQLNTLTTICNPNAPIEEPQPLAQSGCACQLSGSSARAVPSRALTLQATTSRSRTCGTGRSRSSKRRSRESVCHRERQRHDEGSKQQDPRVEERLRVVARPEGVGTVVYALHAGDPAAAEFHQAADGKLVGCQTGDAGRPRRRRRPETRARAAHEADEGIAAARGFVVVALRLEWRHRVRGGGDRRRTRGRRRLPAISGSRRSAASRGTTSARSGFRSSPDGRSTMRSIGPPER